MLRAAFSTCHSGALPATTGAGTGPGDNLFANSIVAVEALTGKYLWHFQTVHHDLWDFDLPNPPVLVDIEQNGRRCPPALASIGKTAWVFILDRVTGAPVFGVEERPVPSRHGAGRVVLADSTRSGEARRSRWRASKFVKERDMVRPEDTSPQHAAACEELWERSGGFANAGPYTPFGFHARQATLRRAPRSSCPAQAAA